MKALITGATGFIGSHLAELLLSKGFEIRCIVRKTSNLQWLKDKPYQLLEANFSDKESINKAVEGVDYIFHVAGQVAGRTYNDFLKSNRDSVTQLLDAVVEKNPTLKRFVLVSSQTAAGPSVSLKQPKLESDECNPITKYGKSKLEGEIAAAKYMDKVPITIVRPSAVYGPRDTATLQLFQAVNMGVGVLIGTKPKYVSIVNSSDLVRGIAEAGLSENSSGKTYFISSEKYYNWEEIFEAMKVSLQKNHLIKIKFPHFAVKISASLSQFFGKFSKKPPIFDKEKGEDFIQEFWTCSVENAKKDFGYKQLCSLEDGFVETVKWYRDYKWLK